jgi:YtkA-like
LYKKSVELIQSFRERDPYLGVIMKNKQRLATIIAVFALFTITISSWGAMRQRAGKPAADQFGFGPRTSAQSLYTATLEPAVQPLKARRMLEVQVTIRDAAGQPVDGAAIEVDGGMPQHGHGLPTKPRVTKNLGEGRYEIEGLRFNMGGWWELHLTIATPAGTDLVTFNLQV